MILADFHVHSPFSRATSKDMSLPVMELWARRKGIHVLGTGDVTHPGQGEEIRKHLVPAEEGLFRLRDESRQTAEWAPRGGREVRFCLTGEISNIYKRGGRVRKVHNVVILNSFAAMDRFREKLDRIGNIRSDGRPILGLDSRDLFEILLEADPDGWLIPAHIWTPWFSVLGSKSGFDAVEECYADLADRVFALETGLSSDPPMNDRLTGLDRYRLISCSDAHSARNLMREGTLFDCPLSLPALRAALTGDDPHGYLGTLEFFPEEGKYHLDGHRKCGVCLTPEETLAQQGICPVCGKPVTVGVLSRVVALADRGLADRGDEGRPFLSLLPLAEVIAGAVGKGKLTKTVGRIYRQVVTELGTEYDLLTRVPIAEIAAVAGPVVAEGVRRVRAGTLAWEPGYDGEYGKPTIFKPGERDDLASGEGLFGALATDAPFARKILLPTRPAIAPTPDPGQSSPREESLPETDSAAPPWLTGLDGEQLAAATAPAGPLLISAPPGSGKTRTLVARTAEKILGDGLAPERVVVVTFTRKAAAELCERLALVPGLERAGESVRAGTIHALCLQLLRAQRPNLRVTGRVEAGRILRLAAARMGADFSRDLEDSFFRNRLRGQLSPAEDDLARAFAAELDDRERLDLDGLVLAALALVSADPDPARVGIDFLAVDEYQDVDPITGKLLDLLAGPDGDFTAIGDPDQSIYSFRGGDREIFTTFARRHQGTRELRLATNYRATRILVAAAQPFIAAGKCDPGRGDKGVPLTGYTAPTAAAEAEFLVHEIEHLVGGVSHFSLDSGRTDGVAGDYGFRDIAVLYRTRQQETVLVEALSRLGVPYVRSREEDSLTRAVLVRLAGQLRLLLPPADDLDLEMALGTGLGNGGWQAAHRIGMAAKNRAVDLAEAIETHRLVTGIAKGPRERLQALALALPRWRRLLADEGKSLLADMLAGFGKEGLELAPDLVEGMLAQAGSDLPGLADLLATGQLQDLAGPNLERVTLATLHGSKGREFPLVFMVGLEAGFLPFNGGRQPADPAEERRLFFVGMTRAKDALYLTGAKRRLIHGQEETREPSPFLAEIPEHLLTVRQPQAPAKKQSPGRQLDLFGDL